MKEERLNLLLKDGHISQYEYLTLLLTKNSLSQSFRLIALWCAALFLTVITMFIFVFTAETHPTLTGIITLVTGVYLYKAPKWLIFGFIKPLMLSMLGIMCASSLSRIIANHFASPIFILGLLGFVILGGSYYYENKLPKQHLKTIRLVGAVLLGVLIGELTDWQQSNPIRSLYLIHFSIFAFLLNSTLLTVVSTFLIISIFTLSSISPSPLLVAIFASLSAYLAYLITLFDRNTVHIHIATIFSRTMIIFANSAMAVASTESSALIDSAISSHLGMAFLWAVLLIFAIIFGEIKKKRWLVVISILFLILNAYIQIVMLIDRDEIMFIALGLLSLAAVKIIMVTAKKDHYR